MSSARPTDLAVAQGNTLMSSTRLYVGNLSRFTSQLELKQAFAEHGTVLSVALVRDRRTGHPKGFGFVEYEMIAGARDALLALNGSMLHGHLLSVDIDCERTPRATHQRST